MKECFTLDIAFADGNCFQKVNCLWMFA